MKDLIDLQGLFNCSRPDYPGGHGAFDPDQLLERTEDVKDDPCEYCSMFDSEACNNCDLK